MGHCQWLPWDTFYSIVNTCASKWTRNGKLKLKLVRPEKTRRFSNHMSRLLSRSHTFAIIVILDLKRHQSMWIHWPFFPKTWTKGHWPLDDLWPHVCWGHMCDSTQGSLCPSPMTIHQCMWIQWSILQNTTYIHILHTYYILHTTYRMSDHIVSYWTQFRRDKNKGSMTLRHARMLTLIVTFLCTQQMSNISKKWKVLCRWICIFFGY